MLYRVNVLVTITIFLILAACSDNAPNVPSAPSVPNASEYTILEDMRKRNIKRTVRVELPSRTNEETLRAYAEQIHALSNVDVERTFITYIIAGDHKNQGYWATTHYNPHLRVHMMGATASDYEKIKNTALPKGEVLGAWMSAWGYDHKMIAFKKDGQTYMRSILSPGGSPQDEIYELSQSKKGIKLQSESDKDHHEYFIINPKGNLEYWSENGNYYTTYRAIQQSTAEIPVN
tara:strand:+ start:469 stop:1167 length:699 start_codon:yes stop_codon:yes gene_type:complete